MKIGCPREIKNHEYRVGLVPAAAKAYVKAGHEVFLEAGAGLGSGITDTEYTAVGAQILPTAAEVWAVADMIVKVKEPLPQEFDLMRRGQAVYTYFHFAADAQLTRACMAGGIKAIAYETVQEADGSLPLLKPMSEVAGRMAPLIGAYYLARVNGGRGILASGVPGVAPASVLVLGGGTVGSNAARVAAGLGARVTVLDINIDTLEHLGNILPPNVTPIFADPIAIEHGLRDADLIVGAVLVTGARAPRLIKRKHLRIMKKGAVFVDVAIDQGGCSETSHPTSHDAPIYVEEGIVHYCVTNMPGAYARTSTFALNNRTIRYGLKLANLGVEKACSVHQSIRMGLNLYEGQITYKPVAEALSLMKHYAPVEDVLAAAGHPVEETECGPKHQS